jgi:methionyl-tRNA formyltransferase
MKILIATIKSWNLKNAYHFKKLNENINEIEIISDKDQLNINNVKRFKPDYIFFPHWSWIIPQDIFSNYKCILFHMTDLPFGRGGSPLQNLIAMGIEHTKISAIEVKEGFDTGDIYLKEELCLNGTAEEIFMRASKVIFETMIPKIIKGDIIPYNQIGEPYLFKRRKMEDGEIGKEFGIDKCFDYIRMLDCEDYPKAFIKYGNLKIQFSRVSKKHGRLIAEAVITEEGKDE